MITSSSTACQSMGEWIFVVLITFCLSVVQSLILLHNRAEDDYRYFTRYLLLVARELRISGYNGGPEARAFLDIGLPGHHCEIFSANAHFGLWMCLEIEPPAWMLLPAPVCINSFLTIV